MKKSNPAAPQDITNRPAEADELDFEEDVSTIDLDEPHKQRKADTAERNAGLTEASQPGQGPTNDDLAPETLIAEDGARSQHEPEQGNMEPVDKTLSIVRDTEIGGGSGLDEAELAQVDPWNRKKHLHKKS